MSRPRGTDRARVIQVIETTSLRGEGTETDKCRMVKQYWGLEGKLLAENDPCMKPERIYQEPDLARIILQDTMKAWCEG